MTVLRQITPLDHLLTEAQRALDTVFGNPPAARPYPATETDEPGMDRAERRHAAGLMRINHVGEVCAQGLYFGQAAVARDPATREHLLEAAQEETDHLAWCATRAGVTTVIPGARSVDQARANAEAARLLDDGIDLGGFEDAVTQTYDELLRADIHPQW